MLQPRLKAVPPSGARVDPPKTGEAPAAPPPRQDYWPIRTIAALTSETTETAILLGWVTHDVRQVADSSGRIAAAAGTLSDNIADLSVASVATAEEAEKIAAETGQCQQDMHGAGESMRQIRGRVLAMNDRLAVLEGAVMQIADMAKTIEAISKQTNLLALNATIEAARAGEAGRGFAVVAGEVKSLSGQTAQATDQIRTRLATLTAEMAAIKTEIEESDNAVAAGERTVERAEQRIGAVGSRVSGMTDQVRSLVDMLSRQSSATDEISSSVKRIADKATKVRTEVDSSLERLVTAEKTALDIISAQRTKVPALDALARARTGLGVWKRKLAAAFVGLAKPSPGLADEAPRLAQWCAEGPEALRHHHGADALRAAEARSHTEAAAFLKAAAASDQEGATKAYVALEKTLGEITRAADTLIDAATAA
jgi:archaellum component FlaC